jgi:voltage-gated sodium channel
MRRFVDWLVSDRLVMAVIVLNASALVLHEMADQGSTAERWWFWIDYVCVIFFLVEALAKIGRDGWRDYWSSGWNRFDLTVVVVSLPALLGPFFDVSQFAVVLILRLGRLFRLFRVLRFIPNLDHLVAGIRRALRASIGVFLALLLINLILAVMATLMFRDLDPEHFGNPVVAGYSVFQVFTVEGWNEIAESLAEKAEKDPSVASPRLMVVGARIFFVVAVLVGGILGLSLANAVFVDEMMMDNTENLERKVDALTEEVRRLREDVVRTRSP